MKTLAAFLLALLTIGSAHAQVKQTGTVTPGHAVKWYSNGVVGDAGPAGGSQTPNGNYLTELGITNTGTPLCITDSLTNAAGGYHQLCFAALTTIGANTGAFITYNNYGVAAADSLYFNINGTNYAFPFTVGGIVGPGSTTVNNVACWNNVSGSLLKDCGPLPTQNPETANTIFAGPTTGSAATPTFRALVSADFPGSTIPNSALATDPTNASNLASGTVSTARGGAGTITGALKGNGSGVVSQASINDLSDTTSCASWNPTDQSGASLVFTSVSAIYCKYGNIVYIYGTVTYPTTSNGNSAKISLPVGVPNQPYAVTTGIIFAGFTSETVVNSNTFAIFSNAGSAATNSSLSASKINFNFWYPAS